MLTGAGGVVAEVVGSRIVAPVATTNSGWSRTVGGIRVCR